MSFERQEIDLRQPELDTSETKNTPPSVALTVDTPKLARKKTIFMPPIEPVMTESPSKVVEPPQLRRK